MKTNNTNSFFRKAFLVALAFTGLTVAAQEEEEVKKFQIGGSVDTYFRTNLTTSNVGGAAAPETSFANRGGFSVGMVNLIASYSTGNVGFVGDLVYGPRGANAVDGSGSENIVNQAYAYWNMSDEVTLTIGRFNTYLGYEVISPTGNFNYSTSYMFSNGPFSHNGAKLDFAIDDNWSAMVSIMNPTDVTFGNPADTYIGGAQVGYSDDSGSAYLNFRYGNESGLAGIVGPTFQVDLTTGWDISEEFFLGFNATYKTDAEDNGAVANDPLTAANGFYGVAIYPQVALSDDFSLGLRGEFFGESLDVDNVDDATVTAITLSGQYKVGDLTFIPEFRIDSTDEDNPISGTTFTDRDGDATGSLASFLIGAVYSF